MPASSPIQAVACLLALAASISRRIISSLLFFALLGVSPLSAQQAQTGGDQSPAIVAGRDATINYGLTPEQVQELTKAYVRVRGQSGKQMLALSSSQLLRDEIGSSMRATKPSGRHS
jgi:hypothetical protein